MTIPYQIYIIPYILPAMSARGTPVHLVTSGRPTCYHCFRPSSHCVCSFFTRFSAHCDIVILQHPHEWKKYYSTAKLVALAVSNVTILRGIEFNPLLLEEKLNRPNTYLLFPGPHTKDCEEVQLDSQSTVVVIDGTWDEAGKIVHRNPALQKLPTLSFKKPLVSNYKIRKQPKESYLSTIESIAHLLKLNALAFGLNNKTTEYDSLFTGFNRMVDQQLSYFPRNRLVLD